MLLGFLIRKSTPMLLGVILCWRGQELVFFCDAIGQCFRKHILMQTPSINYIASSITYCTPQPYSPLPSLFSILMFSLTSFVVDHLFFVKPRQLSCEPILPNTTCTLLSQVTSLDGNPLLKPRLMPFNYLAIYSLSPSLLSSSLTSLFIGSNEVF